MERHWRKYSALVLLTDGTWMDFDSSVSTPINWPEQDIRRDYINEDVADILCQHDVEDEQIVYEVVVLH